MADDTEVQRLKATLEEYKTTGCYTNREQELQRELNEWKERYAHLRNHTVTTEEHHELVQIVRDALQDSACDGDLCSRDWHERARKVLAGLEE